MLPLRKIFVICILLCVAQAGDIAAHEQKPISVILDTDMALDDIRALILLA